MSTSSEEASGIVGDSTTSSGLESTVSVLFSAPSDLSDIQTESTPPASPALSEGKMRILDTSHRLRQTSASALQVAVTPTRHPRQLSRHISPASAVSDEAGYDADGDGDGDGDSETDRDGGARGRGRSGAVALRRPIHRPGFIRIDTRQHRRVASMLAIRRPSPGFGEVGVDVSTKIVHPPRAMLAPLPFISLKHGNGTTTTGGETEHYELQQRPRMRAVPVGLGIGFPENHPLRSRAFTMPVSSSRTVSPVDDPSPPMKPQEQLKAWMDMDMDTGVGDDKGKERRPEWFPSSAWFKKSIHLAVPVCAPSPVRLVKLRPTFLEMSPSPIEYLPGVAGVPGVGVRGGARYHYDVDIPSDVHDQSETSGRDHGSRHMSGPGCDAEERTWRDTLAGRRGLTKSMPACPGSEVTTTLEVGPDPALFHRAL